MTKGPEAIAFPVQTNAEPLQTVELPIGCQDLGFSMKGSPIRITEVSPNSPLKGLKEGHFIHGLVMPDIEIVMLADSNHLANLLNVNIMNPRHLLVSHNMYFIDPSIGSNAVAGAMYKHRLPAAKDLGFTLVGFPPVIHCVTQHSIFVGKLHPGQTVEALIVPGMPVFNLGAGGFTNAKLQERLNSTSHIEGRQLVVKDVTSAYGKGREKGSSAAFDDCVIQ